MISCVRVISINVMTMTPDDTPLLAAYHKPIPIVSPTSLCPVFIHLFEPVLSDACITHPPCLFQCTLSL